MDKTEIQEDIKRKIFTENLKPGDFLVERDLCETYNISRTPMREILWMLAAEGLVSRQAGKGFTVRALDWKDLSEVFETREALEGLAARLCCQKLSGAGRKRLEGLKIKLKKIGANVTEEGPKLGRILHQRIIDEADNSLLNSLYEKVRNLALLTTGLTKKSKTIEEHSRLEHISVIEKILAGKAANVETTMRNHIRGTYRRLIERLYPGMDSSRADTKRSKHDSKKP